MCVSASVKTVATSHGNHEQYNLSTSCFWFNPIESVVILCCLEWQILRSPTEVLLTLCNA